MSTGCQFEYRRKLPYETGTNCYSVFLTRKSRASDVLSKLALDAGRRFVLTIEDMPLICCTIKSVGTYPFFAGSLEGIWHVKPRNQQSIASIP